MIVTGGKRHEVATRLLGGDPDGLVAVPAPGQDVISKAGEQIGFARCITDYASSFLLVDVIIDDRFRGQGLGKALVSFVVSHESLQGLTGTLATRDAHTLYEQFGFMQVDPKLYMRKPAK